MKRICMKRFFFRAVIKYTKSASVSKYPRVPNHYTFIIFKEYEISSCLISFDRIQEAIQYAFLYFVIVVLIFCIQLETIPVKLSSPDIFKNNELCRFFEA
jgi:hypothetical protein